MKVIVNGRFLLHRTTGVERYAREILHELDNLIQPNEIIMAVPREATNIPLYKNIEVVKVGRLKNRLWEHISFPRYVRKMKGISLNLCNVAPLSNPGIVVIHDMKIKAHPEYFSTKFRLWYKILFSNETRRAKKIITVSEFSKKEILKYYNVLDEKVVVIPNAWQHFDRIQYDENSISKYGLKKNEYFFALGSMDPNKNFTWIAEKAMESPNKIFAIAGSVNKKVFSSRTGIEWPENMKSLGFVSDEEAKTLMRDCEAFLFPSIYEGFGIPPLEAMSTGCQNILVSDTQVMHEIFEDKVNYIGIIENKKTDGYADILDKYSWNKSARMLVDLVREMRV